jgi:hypothetical protein
MAVPSKAANGSAGGGSTGTGSGGGVEAALASFGTAMTGWGRNLLNAGGVVDSFSNNEGIKALVSGGLTQGLQPRDARGSEASRWSWGLGAQPGVFKP